MKTLKLKKIHQIIAVFVIMMAFIGSGAFIYTKAYAASDVLKIEYYKDKDLLINRIGSESVEYEGLSDVNSVEDISIDKLGPYQNKYIGQSYGTNGYYDGELVSYNKYTKTLKIKYEQPVYTIEYYKDSVSGELLGTESNIKAEKGMKFTDKTVSEELRNKYLPEKGYSTGRIDTASSDTEITVKKNYVVKVVYKPIETKSKIYFFNESKLSGYACDAILIESNGHFGMVDCGEDKDYPDGSNPKYPFRDGIVDGTKVDEQDLIDFLEEKGVTELDFIIFTHAHSDHMGAGDEIIDHFKVKKVYAREYDDKYISNKNHLWDTQYVYDTMIDACKRNNVELIQDFDYGNDAKFEFFGLDIQILNYDASYEFNEDGSYKLDSNGEKVRKLFDDENQNSLAILVTDLFGHKVFLAGDINNYDGAEDRLAQNPLLQNVDVFKVAHHCSAGSNTENLLKTLHPKYAVITKSFYSIHMPTYNYLKSMGTEIYAVQEYSDGIVLNVSDLVFELKDKYEGFQYDEKNDLHYYYVDGEKIRGQEYLIDGNTYRFKEFTGEMYVSEWYKDGDKYYYYDESGIRASGITFIGDKRYYFDKNGVMFSDGIITIDGAKYHFNEEGIMTVGEAIIYNSSIYFFDESGMMIINDWGNEENYWYYLGSEGTPLVNQWIKYENNWYYLDSLGRRVENTWMDYNGKRYYLDSEGVMATSKWIQDEYGQWYYMDSEGLITVSKWIKYENNWYYLNADGTRAESKWIKSGEDWYYLDSEGVMAASKWIQSGSKWYYMDADGIMTSSKWIQSKSGSDWYYVNADGAMAESQWIQSKSGEDWYYLNADGTMAVSKWVQSKSGEDWYYLNADGTMAVSKWIQSKSGENWYYINADGTMAVSKWIQSKSGEDWYYVNADGIMVVSKWVKSKSGEDWYYINADGTMATSKWITTDEKKYYVDKDGIMVTGWNTIDDKEYYMFSNGVMAHDIIVDGHYIDSDGVYDSEHEESEE